jgi:hypothetical protein
MYLRSLQNDTRAYSKFELPTDLRVVGPGFTLEAANYEVQHQAEAARQPETLPLKVLVHPICHQPPMLLHKTLFTRAKEQCTAQPSAEQASHPPAASVNHTSPGKANTAQNTVQGSSSSTPPKLPLSHSEDISPAVSPIDFEREPAVHKPQHQIPVIRSEHSNLSNGDQAIEAASKERPLFARHTSQEASKSRFLPPSCSRQTARRVSWGTWVTAVPTVIAAVAWGWWLSSGRQRPTMGTRGLVH